MSAVPMAAALMALAAAAAPAQKPAGKPKRSPAAATPLKQPAASTSPLPLRPVSVRPRAASGSVRFVAASLAYLDAGSRDGILAGATVDLVRRGRPAGRCTVEAISERSATCAGAGLRAGDTFRLPEGAAAAAGKALPPQPTAEEQARRLAAVKAAAFTLVERAPSAARPAEADRVLRSAVSLGAQLWGSVSASTQSQLFVNGTIRGAELGSGFRLWVDAQAVYRAAESDTERFQPGQKAFLLVRELQVARRDPGVTVPLSAGRVMTWGAVGSSVFDGAQVGWRPSEKLEVGLFGGFLPLPATTEPTLDQSTGGAYWAVERASPDVVVRHQGRLAVVEGVPAGGGFAAELMGEAWLWRELDLSAQLRYGSRTGALEYGAADLGWRRAGSFSLLASYRHFDLPASEPAAPAVYPGRTDHFEGAATLEALGPVSLRLFGGWASDAVSGNERSWVGPEILVPKAWKSGGFSAGYAEEFGWLSGRSLWAQGDFAPGTGTRLMARLAFTMDSRPAPLSADSTVGVAFSGLFDLNAWLRLRLSLLSRFAIPSLGGEGSTVSVDWGATGLAALEGRY
ncbi:MAG TPA: hypothetical protein VFR85_10430 [Anaeromyxobacteraceae bacterium]|nr:hypothetical protein [Anaeromyxobacteraceae bacterium]